MTPYDTIETWLLKKNGVQMKENVPFVKGKEFLEPLETISTTDMLSTCNPTDSIVDRTLNSREKLGDVIVSKQGRTGISESTLEGSAFYDPAPPRGDSYLKR